MLSVLSQVANFFYEQQAALYLVGGSLRNLLLGEPCNDWDLVTDGNGHKLARRLANQLGGSYAYFHEKASRVSIDLPETTTSLVLDIAPMRSESIEENLQARDFTLNAMAAPLHLVLECFLASGRGGLLQARDMILDPTGGLTDLATRSLRVTSSEAFRHDPLRLLRALRLAQHYQLTIASETAALMQRDAALLTRVAAERIHEELFLLLSQPGALVQLHNLDTYGLLATLIPELQPARDMAQPAPHYWDVFEHSLQSVGLLETLGRALENGPESTTESAILTQAETASSLAVLHELLLEASQQGIFQFADLQVPRMKLSALLHDIGKPLTYTVSEQGAIHFYNHPLAGAPVASEIMRRLSASSYERRLAFLVAAHHMRPGQLGQESVVTTRAIRRYFVDLGPAGILIALFSLADHLATLGPQPPTSAWSSHLALVRLLLTRYIRERTSILPPRLVRAEELISRLKLEPGPIIGQLLELIAEAQADGAIHSREEAILLAREHMQKQAGSQQ